MQQGFMELLQGKGFRVIQLDGCLLTFGDLPVEVLHNLLLSAEPGWRATWKTSHDLAMMADADLAMGSPEDLAALAAKLQDAELDLDVLIEEACLPPRRLFGQALPARTFAHDGACGCTSCVRKHAAEINAEADRALCQLQGRPY